jgi:uncharacterized delta-60 repeat protein
VNRIRVTGLLTEGTFSRRLWLALAAALALAVLSPTAARAAPGDLDPDFGTGGRVTVDFGGSDRGREAALLPDGRLVIAGYQSGGGDFDFGVARLTVAGAPDPSFGGGSGTTSIDPTPGEDDWPVGLALQPDGKPVVGGYFNEGVRNAGLVRLRTDGLPDVGFGTAGIAEFPSVINKNVGGDVLVLPDGKLLWVGSGEAGGDQSLNLIRFDAAGNPDPSFGSSGLVAHSLRPAGELEQYRAVVRQPDGKILVGGEVQRPATVYDMVVVRLLPNGELDPSFDGDGFRYLDFLTSDGLGDLALQPDGKIVVAGSQGFGADIAVARLLPDGAPDPGFDGDGLRSVDLGGDDHANGVALQADGAIVLAGTTDATGDKDMFVHRLTVSGASDPGFALGGTRIVDFAGLDDRAEDVVVQADGAIVAVGSAQLPGETDFAAVRLRGEPGPAASVLAPADTVVGLRIVGKRIRVNRRGVAKLRLHCPASEASPPCRGRLVLRTQGKLSLGKGKKAKKRRVVLAKGAFKVAKGKTKVVKLRLGKGKQRLLAGDRRARKVLAIARVRDGAGNSKVVRKKMRAVPVKAKAKK